MRLEQYTDQQNRIARSFSHGGSCCSAWCEPCGRTYFVTSDGHGDYSDGELEQLRSNAESDPNRYIEVPDFASIDTMIHPVTGKQLVVGCVCDPTESLSLFIEHNADELTAYLREYWKDQRTAVALEEKRTADRLKALGWSPMSLAPKDTTEIEVETTDGSTCIAHWASDLTGEEQPAFEGWFTRSGNEFSQVTPIHWRHVESVVPPLL